MKIVLSDVNGSLQSLMNLFSNTSI